jgi:hypothetical protein
MESCSFTCWAFLRGVQGGAVTTVAIILILFVLLAVVSKL